MTGTLIPSHKGPLPVKRNAAHAQMCVKAADLSQHHIGPLRVCQPLIRHTGHIGTYKQPRLARGGTAHGRAYVRITAQYSIVVPKPSMSPYDIHMPLGTRYKLGQGKILP
jgi:hypothetical protein